MNDHWILHHAQSYQLEVDIKRINPHPLQVDACGHGHMIHISSQQMLQIYIFPHITGYIYISFMGKHGQKPIISCYHQTTKRKIHSELEQLEMCT